MSGNSREVADLLFSGISYVNASRILLREFNELICQGNISYSKTGIRIQPICFVIAQSLECFLKAYLIHIGISVEKLKHRKYGHNLKNIHDKCIEENLYKIIDHNTGVDLSFRNGLTKIAIRMIIEKLDHLHNNEKNYADRYFNSERNTGYPQFDEDIVKYLDKIYHILLDKGLESPEKSFHF